MSGPVMPFTVHRGGKPAHRRMTIVPVGRAVKTPSASARLRRLQRLDPFAASVVETMIDNLLGRIDSAGGAR
jgi:hypothetical protein